MALGHPAVAVGHHDVAGAETGVTVVLPPPGTLGACSVRGGAPGTREAAALGPVGQGVECHGVVLTGGSAFGLAAADGVVRWCEDHGRGLDVGVARVPVIGAAVVFDLRDADHPRPDAGAGRRACEAASTADPAMGRVGAGRGCTVGKLAGRSSASPGGVGWAVRTDGAASVGALMVVNAFGEVVAGDGTVLAGTVAPSDAPRYPSVPIDEVAAWDDPGGTGRHTTIGCLVTNVRLDKPAACRAVDLAHGGIARATEPHHTAVDGDALFLLCTQEVDAPADLVAQLGTQAVAAAIRAAVTAP